MIKIILITDFCNLSHSCRTSIESFQSGPNNYSEYMTFVDNADEATHAIIINTE